MFVVPGGTTAESSIDVSDGFYGLSFFYSSAAVAADAVQVWSGLDGTGDLLTSFSLAANATDGGCTDSPYCHWDQLSASFGRARSVTFGPGTEFAAFDNIGVVPEPATVLLAGLALTAAFVTRRRA